MNFKLKKFWIALIILVYLEMTYSSHIFRLSAVIGSLSIVFLARLAWPESWKHWLGLNINTKSLIFAILITPMIIFASDLFIQKIVTWNSLSYQSWLSSFDISTFIHSTAQPLNEEMILGALLLNSSRRGFPGLHPLWLAIIAAAVFSLLHYPFYAWMVTGTHTGKLTILTLLTLFTIGVVRNNLILTTHHIGYAWALHFGFNLVFLRGLVIDANGQSLNQPQSFNLILGSQTMVIIGILLLLASLLLYRKDVKLMKKHKMSN